VLSAAFILMNDGSITSVSAWLGWFFASAFKVTIAYAVLRLRKSQIRPRRARAVQ
jgi:hypothetical protein